MPLSFPSMIYLSAILLSGGVGSRMEASTPKQYLPLAGKRIALHAFERLISFPHIEEVIVVCHPAYRSLFPTCPFAEPGERRQDSLFNGLQMVNTQATHILVHDAARPLLSEEDLTHVIEAGLEVGSATIKQADSSMMVTKTHDRSTLFTIQTPQVIKKEILLDGFRVAQEKKLTVTDDVSLAELVGQPVKLMIGSSENIKITTPEDLILAESLLNERLLSV